MSPSNPTLKNHHLLTTVSWSPSSSTLSALKSTYPDLTVSHIPLELAKDGKPKTGPSKEDYEKATVLLIGHMAEELPEKDVAQRLEYVQMSSAGANLILDVPVFRDTDIKFCTANGVHGPQISEWIIATFLAHQHHMPYFYDRQREGTWKRTSAPTVDAVKQRVGILGYGSIGRQTARVATAMGMSVHAYTLHPRSTPSSRRDDGWAPPGIGDPDGTLPEKWFSGGSTEDLHAFLGSDLDLLVVSMPLTPKTKGLLGKKEFEVMSGKKTFISNIARGGIIKTDELIEALDKEVIRGAALDVTDPEPLPDGHPLWKAKNVIITPHVSGHTTHYNDRVWAILEHNLKRLSQGEELSNVVSRKNGY